MNEEHNMTLRERFNESKFVTDGFIGGYTNCPSDELFKWFLAQFDAMLAEDIDKMRNYFAYAEGYEESRAFQKCGEVIEARRLFIKK